MNFAKFLRAPFLRNTSGQLLLKKLSKKASPGASSEISDFQRESLFNKREALNSKNNFSLKFCFLSRY